MMTSSDKLTLSEEKAEAENLNCIFIKNWRALLNLVLEEELQEATKTQIKVMR